MAAESKSKDEQSDVSDEYTYYNEVQWTFKDGVKTIDYVIVKDESSRKATKEVIAKRKRFEANLIDEGLELEEETSEGTDLCFVKIHAPLETLLRYAEILHLRLPIKQELSIYLAGRYKSKDSNKCTDCCGICNCCALDTDVFPDCGRELTETYSRARGYLFDVEAPGFFTTALKGRVVRFILERTLYARKKSGVFEFGINSLLMNGVYSAAYPLHDGEVETEGSMRNKFYYYWASFRNLYKNQPGDHIRHYFGVRTGLFFMWLGFYTSMLIPASIVGVVCFFASVVLLPRTEVIDEVCDGTIPDVLCPLCDRYCNFVNITSTCGKTEVLFIFDNLSTVFYAIFITFWAAMFVKLWKRYAADISFHWDLTDLDDRDENPRPEYAAKLSKMVAKNKTSTSLNFITNEMEPKMNFWKYVFPGKVLSITTMTMLISLALAAVIGVILYRMIALYVLPLGVLASITATFFNLVCILVFSPIYRKLSLCLTELEQPRTPMEYYNSIIVKVYCLEFINNYSSIFYIAFFKGKFVGSPEDYYTFFGIRQLECGAGGCMLELTQQLAIIMIGKRAFRSLSNLLKPYFATQLKKKLSNFGDTEELSPWENDFLLQDGGPRMLLPHYIDMVLQYGFVTIFGSAFPLAPLFALLNNIFEIRIAAKKFVLYQRRPTVRRIKDIGVWFDIISMVSYFAIFSNGYIIAFTSNFIPKLVYRLTVSPDYGLHGYMNYTLSYITIDDLDVIDMPNTTATYCRYHDFKEPPWSPHKYESTPTYWTVLAMRFAFFIVYENLTIAALQLVRCLIPDVPQQTKWQMRRKHHLISELIISHEMPKVAGKKKGGSDPGE